jgi:hypothetical protein
LLRYAYLAYMNFNAEGRATVKYALLTTQGFPSTAERSEQLPSIFPSLVPPSEPLSREVKRRHITVGKSTTVPSFQPIQQ